MRIKNSTTNATICEVEINFADSDPDFNNLTAGTGSQNGRGYGVCHFGNASEAHKVFGSYKTLYVPAVTNSSSVCLLNGPTPTASETISDSENQSSCTSAGGE